jgi:cytidylate kinase
MKLPAMLERADTYLNSEWRESRSPWSRERAPGPFVTVSREAGSGGASFARILVRKLNAEASGGVFWRLVEGDVTATMLRENRLPVRIARFLPEEHVPELSASIGELVGLHPNLWDLVQKTNETMRRLAAAGHVILVGRGANFATAGLANGTHVRLVAPPEHRARYLSQLYNISEAESLARNAKCNAARRSYVKSTFNADVTNPSAYHLVFNTAQVALSQAAELVRAHIRSSASARW